MFLFLCPLCVVCVFFFDVFVIFEFYCCLVRANKDMTTTMMMMMMISNS